MSAIVLTPDAVLNGVLLLTREALSQTSEAGVADAIVRIAGELIGADQAALGVVRDGEVITIAALMPPRSPVGSHFPVGFGVAGWVAATGRSAEIQDVRQDKRYVALPYPEVRSFVGVPLHSNDDLLGGDRARLRHTLLRHWRRLPIRLPCCCATRLHANTCAKGSTSWSTRRGKGWPRACTN